MVFFAIFGLLCGRLGAATPIKVACIGNSITQGNMGGVYPTTLQKLLGSGYTVQNDGVSGTTLLKPGAGDNPYWTNGKFKDVFDFQPAIVTIKLGTNDTKSYNWNGHSAQFKKDYETMVDTVSAMAGKPKVWVVLPVPIWTNTYGIQDSVLKKMIPILWQVAFDKKTPLIDAYSALLNFKQYFSDGVHPNAAGADSIASVIYKALTGPPHLLFSDTVVACTVSTGQTGLTAARYVGVCNTTYSPVLDSVTVAGAASWLTLGSANIDRNHQKIGVAIDASKAPQAVKTYTDTLTLSATNAQPPAYKIYVKLTVRQGTAIAATNRAPLWPITVFSSANRLGRQEARISISVNGRFAVAVYDPNGGRLASAIIDGPALRRIEFPSPSRSVCFVRITGDTFHGAMKLTVN